MTKIPENDRNIIEKAIYLPMILIILNRDLEIINNSPFKLKKPYLEWIEETMICIQKELAGVKRYMKQQQIKVEKIKSDDAFTMYMFLYKGYEEAHNYFNPRLRNRSEELMKYYLFQRFQNDSVIKRA
ncbi:hypothetical protein MXL46_17745 [Heyndrickxia sporothermodurans]|uniref:YhjD n=1 Tax=Heyndrickxia sporothermodurans TaxID=46224 RepID=A0AB37HCE6_9BACI|nr:hypothetical protein [Heyndrickxia sporothermodurans]MBL5767847.1 hypothetical protein [Heyndrickxia sporothermodurans]MBL5771430.1 hypothetical protein [Heyndrickxia sporothermodurans]MBL5775106.1 hypothetical protein [Heyndrickxia sporothermodurans]MBL5778534.1 hypothetical protein [Heyndrickxia sporothermodurans]MBL5782145.1 hypothetical protein [Heyndrickxia sporothermodurans]